MSYRFHGRANVDPQHPSAWACCDNCGMLVNRRDLDWDVDWYGSKIQRTGYLVCPRCIDDPQEQLRAMAIPVDPPDVRNPREEPYARDEDNVRITEAGAIRAIEDGDIRVTESG